MGRRPDDPLIQAEKGYPGRRKRRVEAAAEAAAQAIVERPEAGDPLDLPEMFRRAPARWSLAIQIWKRQANVLRTVGRAQPAFRSALARYCIWSQIFEFSADQLARQCPKGDYTIEWTMAHGAVKRMPHSALDIMATAEPIIRALDTEFGFTPRSDSDLTRVETFNQAQGRLPLGGTAPGQRPAGGETHETDPMDLMNASDTAGPHRMN